MTPEVKVSETQAPEQKAESSFSIGKLWDTIIQKDATENQKKAMKDILNRQKDGLTQVVNEYNKGRSDIVWKSGQDKMTLLKDVEQTIQNLKTMSGEISIPDGQQGVMEDSYEKLEAKITGTKETIDFKNPEFIAQAIDNLIQFEANLNATPTRTQAEVDILNQADAMRKNQPPVVVDIPVKTKELIQPVTPAKVETKNFEYTIKKWDILTKIAKDNKTTVDALVKLNNIKDKDKIFTGKTLNIPTVQDKDGTTSTVTNYPPNTKEVQGVKAIPNTTNVNPNIPNTTNISEQSKK